MGGTTDLLTTTLGTFQAVLSLGMYRSTGLVSSLFWGFAVIELLTCGVWWLYAHEPQAGTIVMRLTTLMALGWLLQHWQLVTGMLQGMFLEMGSSLGNTDIPLTLTHSAGIALVDKGFELFLSIQGRAQDPTFLQRLGEAVDALTPTQASMERWILAWCAYFAFIVAGVIVFLVQLQFALFSGIAFLMLPFAAWGRLAWLSDKAFGSVLTCGVTLAFIYALAGIQLSVFRYYVTPVVVSQQGTVSIIITGWFLVALMAGAQKLASGFLHGVPSLTHSDVLPRVGVSVGRAARGMRVAAQAMDRLSRSRKGP